MTPQRALLLLAIASAPPLAQAQIITGGLPFDLKEITVKKSTPSFPGIDFQFSPVGFEPTECGGVAVMDFDNDQLLDVYLPNTEFLPSKLYRNLGGGKFVDVAPAMGVDEPLKRRAGALFLDIENDGDLDLLTIGYPGYTANLDLYSLFRNNGTPNYNFTNVTASAGSFPLAPTTEQTLLGDYAGAAAGDYDGDGYVDFISTWFARLPGYLYDQLRIWRSVPNAPAMPGQLNWSPRLFVDDTITTGLDTWFQGSTWMPSFVDYNRDGMLDLHLNIDFGMDILRLNNGDGTFGPDVATSIGMNGLPAETRNEMGIAFGDIDFDGDFDQFQSNAYWGDRFYRNDSSFGLAGTGLGFTDFAPAVGAHLARYGWGAALSDMDNDRDLDLLRVAGLVVPQSNWFHENQWPSTLADGVTPLFVDRSADVPTFSKSLGNPSGDIDISKALVPFDMDNDGDLDVLVTRPGKSPYINPGQHTRTGVFLNTLLSNNRWLQIDLRGFEGSRNVTGAKVYVRTGGVTQTKQVLSGSSFMSQEPDRLHFGLGNDGPVNWVIVRWPDNTMSGTATISLNAIRKLNKPLLDSLGDVTLDGVVNQADLDALRWAVINPSQAAALFPSHPYPIVGDMNDDNTLDNLDIDLLFHKIFG